MKTRPIARRQRGASAIEFAIAVPVLLVLGLGALQWALVFYARQAIEHAAIEAARAGSVGNALPQAIETGFARGLLPYWSTLPEIRAAGRDRAVAAEAARARVQTARAAGWIVLRRLSPTNESFADWAEPALDGWGRRLDGTVEIPNDGLMFAEQRAPAGGAARTHLGLPVGRLSGQTLLDANILKIEIVYGVPVTVPLVGRLAAATARLAAGCLEPARGGCNVHRAPDAAGRPVPRWPVSAVATLRMQSPARRTDDAPSRASLPQGRTGPGSASAAGQSPAGGRAGAPEAPADSAPPGDSSPGPGSSAGTVDTRAPSAGVVAAPDAFSAPTGPAGQGRAALSAIEDGSLARTDPGWLSFGGDRVFDTPGACVAQ